MAGWDAVVVGGGLGGLSAAAHLAVGGARVLLVEQYAVVGGCGHVFRRPGGWQFEVGVHYLGDCGPGGTIPSLLRGLGLEDRVEFVAFDGDGFDTIVHPGGRLRVPVGWDRYLANLIAAFPGDERPLRRYIGVLRRVGAGVDRRAQTSTVRGLAAAVRMRSGVRWALRPLAALLDDCGVSPEARTVLSTQWLSYGCPPSRAPVLLHVGFLETYLGRGAYYPKGGGQVLAASLVAVIEAHGGEVRTSSRVERILVEGGKVVGVRTDAGERIVAPVVVSNADLPRTYVDLVGAQHTPRRIARRLVGMRLAPSWFNTYIGLDVDLSQWMPATNFFSVPTYDDPDRVSRDLIESGPYLSAERWLEQASARLPAFIHSASRVDPDSGCHAPAGSSVLEVMTNVPADPTLWGTTSGPGDGHYRTSARYADLKARLTDLQVQRAEAALPGIRDHIVYREASTPFTHARYTRSTDGNAYGAELSISQLRRRPRSHGGIDGLYLAGTSTMFGPAVEGVMVSGAITAGAVLDRDLYGEVRAGAVLGDPARIPPPGDGWDPLASSRRRPRTTEDRSTRLTS